MTFSSQLDISFLQLHSRGVILQNQQSTGAYPASPSFSAYAGYCWFRDGAFIADAMSTVGERESAERFFDWCCKVLRREEAAVRKLIAGESSNQPIEDKQMLPTRFTYDGLRGSADWWDFQLDGYGTWLWAIGEHKRRHEGSVEQWQEGISLVVEYLLATWHRSCYDWWEEHSEQIHVSTLGCIAVGLEAAAVLGVIGEKQARECLSASRQIRELVEKRGVVEGHLTKWLGSSEVDGSLSALISPLGFVDPQSDLAAKTLDAIQGQLCVEGGVYRFRADTFYGGGRWPLLSCFLGLALNAAGNKVEAIKLLEWAGSCAQPNGDLPEQSPELLLVPEYRQEWIDRWGQVACPLLWSHAMYLKLSANIERKGN